MRIDSSRYRYLDQQQKPKHLSAGQTARPLSSPIPANDPPCSLPSKEQPYVTMDEKRGFFSGTRSSRRARPLIIIILLGILGCNLWQYFGITSRIRIDNDKAAAAKAAAAPGKAAEANNGAGLASKVNRLVPLEAHIMSKCPDARDCLRDMVLPVMMRAHDKVDWKLSFVGTPTQDDGVDCRHGPSECMGNIIELCAAKLYPDPKISLGFTMCITRSYREIPDQSLIEACALEHAIDIKVLNECAVREDGAYGVGLLRDSVTRTAEAGVTLSCTVRLDDEVYCIRDGGEWTQCPFGAGVNDLVIAIEKKYRQRAVAAADARGEDVV
ncbi:hypothetical protein VdG1_04331 [Verticillium dahliae VDG1]|nr:hypothetical protein VdG1_04331 [Verticillium dahliae VDG1]